MSKPVIVAATGVASGGERLNAKAIEQAMIDATNKCAEEGITDPNVIRERKLAARQALKDAQRKSPEADKK